MRRIPLILAVIVLGGCNPPRREAPPLPPAAAVANPALAAASGAAHQAAARFAVLAEGSSRSGQAPLAATRPWGRWWTRCSTPPPSPPSRWR